MRGRDIVHRDIKPQNLLLQPPDAAFLALGNPAEIPQVKVADFGFARHLSVNTLAETLCGSPLYMAPEISALKNTTQKQTCGPSAPFSLR